MNADIRNAMLKITMDDGTEILGRVEKLEMTRPVYHDMRNDFMEPISNIMFCEFEMFRVVTPKVEEAPRFDLDKMCADALSRLTAQIEADAQRQVVGVLAAFIAARSRVACRHHLYWREIYPNGVVPESLKAWH